ncbi:MAG: hypothetical protein KatS3mg093_026 [Candidatus Parcubacteria bacterium]|nr:MAG: hypothetical protein KatS3mg093_026 [Candidatus Parcubacteria bacterium]
MYKIYYAGFIPGVILIGEIETLGASFDSLIVYEVPPQLLSFFYSAFDFSSDLELLPREITPDEKSILAYPSGVSLNLNFLKKLNSKINFLAPSFLSYSEIVFCKKDIIPLQHLLSPDI